MASLMIKNGRREGGDYRSNESLIEKVEVVVENRGFTSGTQQISSRESGLKEPKLDQQMRTTLQRQEIAYSIQISTTSEKNFSP